MGGLVINGGHNVVIMSGHIQVPYVSATSTITQRMGLELAAQTGTVHVEGLLIDGPDLSEGIDLEERSGATVQIENVRVGPLHARDEIGFTDNHPDVIQTWAGPKVLRVDRLTGITDFQGLMLDPAQIDPYSASAIELQRINIAGLPTAHKLFLKVGDDPMTYQDVWATPPSHPALSIWTYVFPNSTWADVQQKPRPEGDFVPPGTVGNDYVSPGYTP